MKCMDELYQSLDDLRSQGAAIVDVRTPDEFSQAHIKGAINLPHAEITPQSLEVLEGSTKVCVFCQKGGRAQIAFEILQSLGVQNLVCISEDGMGAWVDKGYPVEKG